MVSAMPEIGCFETRVFRSDEDGGYIAVAPGFAGVLRVRQNVARGVNRTSRRYDCLDSSGAYCGECQVSASH